MTEVQPLTIAITGAGGFLGRHCVAEARKRGHRVIAITRSSRLAEWQGDEGISVLSLDLASGPAAGQTLAEALPPGAVLIHAAAHLGDNLDALLRDSVEATLTTIKAAHMKDARLVLISSLAIYDTEQLAPNEALTESSPVLEIPKSADPFTRETLLRMRDPYAGTKALQEFILTGDPDLKAAWILRPGIIWGPGRSWHSLQGFWASKLHVTIGSDGELPLSHVYSVAALAITAAEIPPDGVQIVNIYDDDRPTRARFLKAHKRCYGWPHFNLSVPYGLWSALIPLFAPISHRLPGLFQGPILRARIMPLRFPNTKLRSVFGGEDIDSFEDMMARTKEAES